MALPAPALALGAGTVLGGLLGGGGTKVQQTQVTDIQINLPVGTQGPVTFPPEAPIQVDQNIRDERRASFLPDIPVPTFVPPAGTGPSPVPEVVPEEKPSTLEKILPIALLGGGLLLLKEV